MNKGFAYTTFAVLSSSLILALTFTQVMSPTDISVSDAERISEASFFVESLFSDVNRALEIATRRAMTAATNQIVLTGEPLDEPGEVLSEVLVNGTLDGEELNGTENASLREWESRVQDIAVRSGYRMDIRIKNYSFSVESFEVDSNFTVFASLKDPTTLATFNRTRSTSTSTSIEDLEDPMILLRSEGRYITKYRKCQHDMPAYQAYTGTQNSSGYTQGYAEVQPSDASTVANKSEKILVADDIENYDVLTVQDYAGSVSAQESTGFDLTNLDYYVYGTGSISEIDQNDSLILNNNQVWISQMREMFQEGCYVEADRGPDFLERMENKLVNDDGTGIATLIDISELPPELQRSGSAVGYVYFNESGNYGSVRDVKGVSSEHPWFGLDQHHLDYWGMEELAE